MTSHATLPQNNCWNSVKDFAQMIFESISQNCSICLTFAEQPHQQKGPLVSDVLVDVLSNATDGI